MEVQALGRQLGPTDLETCPAAGDNARRVDPNSEVRLVTCLFVDVVGSTDATVRLGPERMQRLLGDAFKAMSAEITDHGGTVEKYVGDAIFALFGATVAHADDAERALRAADASVRWSTSSAAATARLAIRVGIETGEALVNNVAARLQQHAEPGEIIGRADLPRGYERRRAVRARR
jgi:class 3 adenylate cyclase